MNGWCNCNVCASGASCNPVDGRCKCKPGYAGTRCEQLCPEGYFGQVSSTFICHISLISTVLWIRIHLDPRSFGGLGSGSVLGMQIRIQEHGNRPKFQCCGSMTFWGGSGSGSSDPCLWLMDPDSDPAIFVIDLQDVSKKLIFEHNFFCLLLFEATLTSFFKDKKSKRVTKYNKPGFLPAFLPSYVCFLTYYLLKV